MMAMCVRTVIYDCVETINEEVQNRLLIKSVGQKIKCYL